MTTPNIYIACLASYNNGILYGKWLNATQGLDVIQEEIQTMLSQSPIPHAEEWALHDYEGFGSYQLSEYESITTICEIADFIVKHGELGVEVMASIGCDLQSAEEIIENQYHGTYDNELEFATQLFDDCYIHEVPAAIQYYIDYDAFRRDLFMSDYFSITVDGETHVFSHH